MDLLTTTSTKRTKLRSSVYFFGTAAIAGILCNLLLFRFYSPSSHHIPVDIDTVTGSLGSPEQCPTPQSQLLSDPSEVLWQPLPERSVRELQDMVATTKGFYVRDWSLHLGWNNVRYILETAVLHAQLLNRTLVIPSFVYARACEYDIHTCESFAVMVNRNDATQTDEWRELPLEQQMAWRVPMEVMIDVPHLRSVHPVMFVSEYLRLRGVNITMESGPGRWGGLDYHRDYYPSNHTIDSRDYDPSDIVRVDDVNFEPRVTNNTLAHRANEALRKHLEELKKPLMSFADARATISLVKPISDTDELTTLLEDAGWRILHTWDGALGEDLVKWVVKPRIDVAPRDNLRGFIQDYGSRTEEILYLSGEIHHHRKPGSMRFTTLEGAHQFASLVLHDIQATHAVQSLAARVIHRIYSLTGERLWVAAHMRRGDFVRHGWIADKSIEGHTRRVKEMVRRGSETLQHLHTAEHTTYDVPSPLANELVKTREPPRNDDPFYLATDERDPEAIKYLKSNGAILFKDVLSLEDRREFGWPLLLTDVVSLVEQQIMGKGAAYFCGNAWSSVAGGVVNIRAASGWDPQTAAVSG